MSYITNLINNYKSSAGPINIEEISNKIKDEVRLGIKEGVGESVDELIEIMREDSAAKAELLNKLILNY
jgi:hypothetical protein